MLTYTIKSMHIQPSDGKYHPPTLPPVVQTKADGEVANSASDSSEEGRQQTVKMANMQGNMGSLQVKVSAPLEDYEAFTRG
jgi:hypothetical protein